MTRIELAIEAIGKIESITRGDKFFACWNPTEDDIEKGVGNGYCGQCLTCKLDDEIGVIAEALRSLPTPSQRAGSDTEGALSAAEIEDFVSELQRSMNTEAFNQFFPRLSAMTNMALASLPTTPATSDEAEKP